MSRSQYTPPPQSLAREFVEAFFTLFVGVFLQVGRLFRCVSVSKVGGFFVH